jgi:bacteriocin-like protein
MEKKKSIEAFENLNQCELSEIKGGDDRDYIVVIIDGVPTKVYL